MPILFAPYWRMLADGSSQLRLHTNDIKFSIYWSKSWLKDVIEIAEEVFTIMSRHILWYPDLRGELLYNTYVLYMLCSIQVSERGNSGPARSLHCHDHFRRDACLFYHVDLTIIPALRFLWGSLRVFIPFFLHLQLPWDSSQGTIKQHVLIAVWTGILTLSAKPLVLLMFAYDNFAIANVSLVLLRDNRVKIPNNHPFFAVTLDLASSTPPDICDDQLGMDFTLVR